MKRYLIFAYDSYYPGGGWNDYVGSEDTLVAVGKALARNTQDWWHVVDSTTGKIVSRQVAR